MEIDNIVKKRKKHKSVTAFSVCIAVSAFIQLLLSLFAWVGDLLRILMFINTYVLWFAIIFDIISKGVHKHFLLFGFYICFFTFLMGQKFFVVLGGGAIDEFLTFDFLKLTCNEYIVFINLLYLALFGVFCGYNFVKRKHVKIKPMSKKNDSTRQLSHMRKTVMILYWITFFCALLMQVQIVAAKNNMSYTDGYLINVDVNPVLKIGNMLFFGMAFILLSCKPSKIEMISVLGSFLFVEGFLQLFSGRRALFATVALFACWYLIFYSGFYKKDLRGKHYIMFLCFALAGIVLFYFVEVVRSHSDNGASSLLKIIKDFFISTGGSDSTIANIIRHKDAFPQKGIVYFFEPLRDALFDNVIIREIIALVGGAPTPSVPQGEMYLQLHDSFSHWLSYIVNPDLYLSGYGMGTSFIAETYFAFGTIGVVVVSVGLGIFIRKIGFFYNEDNKVFAKAIKLFFAYKLFIIPRGSLFACATDFLYLIAAILLVNVFSKVSACSKARCVQGVKGERIR